MRNDNLLNGIVLADLHFGAINSNRFMEELNGCLFRYLAKYVLKEHRLMDFVVIAGDTFDLSEPLNSTVTQNVIRFLSQLTWYTEHLWVIEGTRSHDALQTETLKVIFDSLYTEGITCIVKFIQKVTSINCYGTKILFLPEEFVSDQEEYYKEWFSEKYDLIFGHGMVDKIWYADDSKRGHSKAPITPVFSVDELCSIGKYVYFGHVHEHHAYGPNGRFKYVGPTTRWEFGKEHDCGFYHVAYDKTSKLADENFVVNTFAQKLDTISMTYKEGDTIELFQNRIINEVTPRTDDCDRLRVIVNIPRSIKDFDVVRPMIFTKLTACKKVVPTIKIMEDTAETTDDTDIGTDSEPTMFANNSTEDIRIQDYIKSTMDKDVSIRSIRDTIGYNKVYKREDDENE